jgi:hypothetical protein
MSSEEMEGMGERVRRGDLPSKTVFVSAKKILKSLLQSFLPFLPKQLNKNKKERDGHSLVKP